MTIESIFPDHNKQKIFNYLKNKYDRVTIGKKELADELGISLGTVNLYMKQGVCIPPYKKIGNKKNSRVVFNIIDVTDFLYENRGL